MKKPGKFAVDVNNTDPAYWEKVLAWYGLGIDQPLTDNSNDASVNTILRDRGHGGHHQDDFAYLRTIVDGDDRFMQAHEIKKAIGADKDRKIPEWTRSDIQIRRLLLTAFPKLSLGKGQRRRAARWARFIHLYYRMGLPVQMVMKEMGISYDALLSLTRTIIRVSKGLTRHGAPRKGPLTVHPMREP